LFVYYAAFSATFAQSANNLLSLYDVPATCFGLPLGGLQQRNKIVAHHKVTSCCLLFICNCWIKCCMISLLHSMWKTLKLVY